MKIERLIRRMKYKMYIKLSDYFFGEDWGDLVYCFYMGDFEGMKDIIEYLEVI